MRAILQRVSLARVRVESRILAEIGLGLMILLGVEKEDTHEKADKLAQKIANLRIFNDTQGKMNLSVMDVHGDAIVVSQFTLMADTRKGNRPSFVDAAPPELASPLVDYFTQQLNQMGVPAQSGEFGAHMLVEITNDGPVTISLKI